MRVLVTGANGFVGSVLCRKLIEHGDDVVGMVRKTSDLSLLKGIEIQKVVGSLDDPESLIYATRGIDIVYHVAAAVTDWGTLDYFRRVNVEGTRNLIEASVKAGVRRFVFVSSVVVHSFIDQEDMNEDSPQLPTPFPYCQTKREAEQLVMSFHKEGKIEVSIVRPGDVFGPGDRVALLKMAGMLERGTICYIGGGKKLGAFAYVENLADGIILAGTKKQAAGEAYIITDGVKLTWRQYFEKLTDALEVPRPRFSVPPSLAYSIAYILETIHKMFNLRSRPLITRYIVAHLSNNFHFSIDKAKRELGYEPKIGMDEAIQKTAEWYRKVVRGEE